MAGGATTGGGGGPLHPDNHAIFVNPADPNNVYTGTDGGIFETTNLGVNTTWTNIDGSTHGYVIPDLPVNDIVINPKNGHLYAAADFGVFFSANGGHNWFRMDNGLPNVPVYQLLFDPTSNTLVAVTHGRGIWRGNAP